MNYYRCMVMTNTEGDGMSVIKQVSDLNINEEFLFRGQNTRITGDTTITAFKKGEYVELPAFATEYEGAKDLWLEGKPILSTQKFRG